MYYSVSFVFLPLGVHFSDGRQSADTWNNYTASLAGACQSVSSSLDVLNLKIVVLFCWLLHLMFGVKIKYAPEVAKKKKYLTVLMYFKSKFNSSVQNRTIKLSSPQAKTRLFYLSFTCRSLYFILAFVFWQMMLLLMTNLYVPRRQVLWKEPFVKDWNTNQTWIWIWGSSATWQFEESQLQLLVLLGAVHNKGSLNIHCFLV